MTNMIRFGLRLMPENDTDNLHFSVNKNQKWLSSNHPKDNETNFKVKDCFYSYTFF